MSLALITGAGRGIGRAIARRLAADGHGVLINYRSSREGAEALATEIREAGGEATLVPFDVSLGAETEAAVTELVDRFGCPDVLVNNAGVTADGVFARMGRDAWSRVMETNLNSFYSVTRPLVRGMMRRRSGRIISLTSVAGVRGNAGQVNYSASKAGLIGATKALAIEIASRGITVNAVAPGFIETEMIDGVPLDKVVPLIPMARVGTAEDVAGVVSFLASEGAAYVTGQVIGVNGGLYT
jgi:3-oxoacyl-[acyl-carrier protein] reductase